MDKETQQEHDALIAFENHLSKEIGDGKGDKGDGSDQWVADAMVLIIRVSRAIRAALREVE